MADAKWSKRWTVGSDWKPAGEMGKWDHAAPEHAADAADKGIKTGEDARFYSLSRPLDAEFNNEGKDLILAMSVQHEQTLDCGGAYIKLLPPGFDQKKFGGDTDYSIMFGPDICGTGTRRTHVIFTYNGENLLTKKNVKCETDKGLHLYTLIVKPDNSYVVRVDDKEVESGDLFEDFDFLAPKEIKDPEASKPDDWVDDAKMPDPEDEKPEGYDDIPAQIPDPDAEKPDDWDDEDDGEWEAPTVDNPEYKGPWEPRMIDNPDYKGPWVHPMIANPDYEEDDTVYNVCKPCSHVGFELWQVTSGTIFDDILVTDSEAEYDTFVESWSEKASAISANAEAAAEAARKAAEEAAAAAKAAEEADEDEDEDEEEDEEDEDDNDHDEL